MNKRRIDITALRYRVTIVHGGQPPQAGERSEAELAQQLDPANSPLIAEAARLLKSRLSAETKTTDHGDFKLKRLWRGLLRLTTIFKRRIGK